MKDVFKGVAIKILSIIVIIAILGGVAYGGYRYMKTKAQVTEEGEKIVVKLPEVEITSAEIDNDSFEKLDESNNIFNPITVEDLNDAQKDLKEKMIAQAINKGILDEAKANAETIIAGMLNGTTDNDIVIDWQ